MNLEIAQRVALVCYGNAVIRGIPVPRFFPEHATCRYCDSVVFTNVVTHADGTRFRDLVYDTPDAWLRDLPHRGVRELALVQEPRQENGLPERQAAAFANGGRLWRIEARLENGMTEEWITDWTVLDRDAPADKIWRAEYARWQTVATAGPSSRPIAASRAELREALEQTAAFATIHVNEFAPIFARALDALDGRVPAAEPFDDIVPIGVLSAEAQTLLRAAMRAYVFGGMGSWNDMQFHDDIQRDYERLSDTLYARVNEAIAVAATSSRLD